MKRKKQRAKKGMTAVLAVLMTASPIVGFGSNERAYAAGEGIYEAEDAVLSAAVVDNQHLGFTGTGFIDYKPNAPGGTVQWNVYGAAAGEQVLEFRYANGGTENRPVSIQLNGQVLGELAFEPTGEWTSWKTTSIKGVLQAGTNVITATSTGGSGGANIDHLRIWSGSTTPGEPAPVELKTVSMEELVNGLLLEKLHSTGIVASTESQQGSRPLTRIEFWAMINRAMGYTSHDTYKNLDSSEQLWGSSMEAWHAYVLEAAQEAGYLKAGPGDSVRPDDRITRVEAAVTLAEVLKLTAKEKGAAKAKDVEGLPAHSKGAIGAVMSEGIMEARGGNFGIREPLRLQEAEWIMSKLALTSKARSAQVEIVRAEAIAPHLVAVVLNGKFSALDVKAIKLKAPAEKWSGMNPKLKELSPTRASVSTNKFGDTVIVYEVQETLQAGSIVNSAPAPSFSGNLQEAVQQAKYLVSWQMDHGGWTKSMDKQYARMWNGVEKRSTQFGPNGEELGSIDNNATITQLRFLASVYQATGDEEIRSSIVKGVQFLLTMQYSSGGWPQVYPKRGVEGSSEYYSNYATFNDNAMIKVMELLDEMSLQKYPFGGSLLTDELRTKARGAVNSGIDFILKSQIQVNGEWAAWCAQHDPVTYEARPARAYEHASVSGSESVGIIRFLMSRPEQTPEIQLAVRRALTWFDKVKLEGIRYVSADPNGVYFVPDPAAVSWYRFYEIGTNLPIFSGRDGVIKRDIREIEQERRDGYSWGGSYAKTLLETAKSLGYYENRMYAEVVGDLRDVSGRPVVKNQPVRVEDETKSLNAIKSVLTVSKDGKGDFTTVMDAIAAVPADNASPVEIRIRNGVYKEMINIPANKPFISLIGESADKTILTYDNYAGKEKPTGGTYGTTGSSSIFLYGSDFSAENLTMENSADESKITSGTQAVAVYARGERMTFKNVRFIGNQDTLYTHSGSQYFYQCYIEGDVDFIFGGARAVFEDCDIVSVDRGSTENNGYITAPSTQISQPYGFLFLNSRLSSTAAANSVHLGRPWHPGGDVNAIGSAVFMNCVMGAHIKDIGWTDMSGFKAADARFYEYGNTGPGAKVTETRRQLTAEQAQEYTVQNVLGGWVPQVSK